MACDSAFESILLPCLSVESKNYFFFPKIPCCQVSWCRLARSCSPLHELELTNEEKPIFLLLAAGTVLETLGSPHPQISSSGDLEVGAVGIVLASRPLNGSYGSVFLNSVGHWCPLIPVCYSERASSTPGRSGSLITLELLRKDSAISL